MVIHHLGTKQQVVIRAHSKRVLHVVFDGSGERALSCGEDGQAFVWNARTGRQISRFPEHSNWVTWGAFSPEGSRVVTASFDRTLRIWNPADGSSLLPLPFELASVARSVEFSVDGRNLVISDFEFRVLILDASSGRVAGPVLHHGEHVVFANLSPRGDQVLSVGQDGTTRIWQLPGERKLPSWTSMDFQPNGQWGIMVTNGQLGAVGLPGGDIRGLGRPAFLERVVSARALQGGRDCVVLSAVSDRDLDSEPFRFLHRLNFMDSGHPTSPIRLPAQFDRLVALGPTLSVASWSVNSVVLHDLRNGRQIWSVEFAGSRVQQLFSDAPGQRIAVTLTRENRQWVQVLDAVGGRALWPAPVLVSGDVKAVAFSPDGRLVAVSCSSSPARGEAAFLFESSSGRPVGEPMVHRDGVLYACFNPQSSLLVTCGEDKAALLWSLETAQQLVRPLLHGDQVARAAFSRDGRWLVTLARNQAVQVWDVGTGDAITPPVTLVERCSEIAFSDRADGIWAWAPADASGPGAVSWIPLRRESRSLEDLSAISRLLSAQHYHYSGALMPSPRALLRESWERIR